MTKTTQDLHSVRESKERLFALKLNMVGSGCEVGGVTRKRPRPIRSAVEGLARRTPPVGVIITERRLIWPQRPQVEALPGRFSDCAMWGRP